MKKDICEKLTLQSTLNVVDLKCNKIKLKGGNSEVIQSIIRYYLKWNSLFFQSVISDSLKLNSLCIQSVIRYYLKWNSVFIQSDKRDSIFEVEYCDNSKCKKRFCNHLKWGLVIIQNIIRDYIMWNSVDIWSVSNKTWYYSKCEILWLFDVD